MNASWQRRPLADLVTSRPGNNRIIKGKQADRPGDGLVQGFSASGPDVWVPVADYNQPGVVISAIGARCGKTFAAEGAWTAIANTHVLLPGEHVDPRWLWYRTNDEEFWIRGGAAQPFVKVKDTLQQPIPIPPREEQQRIVGVLDEAFSGLATAQANAAKNLENARALFESFLQSVFTHRGRNWDRLSLEELIERRWIEGHLDGNHGSEYPRKEEFISTGVPYISANCIEDDRVDMTKSKFLSPDRAALLRKGIARDRDVLFAHNATVGPVAVLRTTEPKVILGTSLTYYRCNVRHIVPEYLAHYMRSSAFKSQYSQVMKQSTRNQVPITKQREFYHIIPPLDEQKTLVFTLEGLFESSQRLARVYANKQAALEALKKSLLHEAFTGNL